MEASIILAVVLAWMAASVGAAFLLGAVIRRANRERRIVSAPHGIAVIAAPVPETLARTGSD